ncbi:MAG: GNAT family N-acetyltransferase [Actinomycetota bacterium]
MADEISIRPVADQAEARRAAELLDRVWQERRVIGIPLLWAMAGHGGQVLAAFRGDEVVGTQVGVVGLREGKPALHSHITGVLPEVQHRGVGFLLKKAQRDWCLERGIERVTWTFDPMVARNAYFNLVKLGAVAERFHRNYYGEMDDAFNRGERSDRVEVVWDLSSGRVRRALGEIPREESEERNMVVSSPVIEDDDGRPIISDVPADAGLMSVAVPSDYHALRDRDTDLAHAWRDAVGDALEKAFEFGFRATSFSKPPNTAYWLEGP